MPDTSSRCLAAILFADIAGYTALMQHDEQDALRKFTHIRQCLEAKTSKDNDQAAKQNPLFLLLVEKRKFACL